ncbi:phosphatase PAP2 family protein [Cellulosilyticum sp. I15G10I2]|uniref:phosphatase PAP2 family protein n=1 Tax=Cellulosilyticum sp. I15G10I2 TaxID=1892843 RepID=UPI00085BEC90|nr:phosphatase PAP2 family protein [Cellulosilyticum sp. I15G10I2]
MNFQIQILQYLESIRTEFLTSLMVVITIMADKLFLIALIACLYWCVDKVKGVRLAWMLLLSDAFNKVIKMTFKMPRPFEKGVVLPVGSEETAGYSFPSGHTQRATSFWSGSMLVLKSKASILMGICIILLTALSRIYLGLHWPADTVGGIAFGVLAVLFANQLLGEKAVISRWHVMAVSCLVLAALIAPIENDLTKSVAALWGMTWGAYMEQKYIHFKPIQKMTIQILKVIIGIFGVLIIYVGVKKMLPPYKVYDMIRYGLLFLWISAGAPYLFKGLNTYSNP